MDFIKQISGKEVTDSMTEGNIAKKIIFFALPIFFGSLFQQLYNTIDAMVVGNVVGKEALAAVTSTGSLVSLLVGLVQGVFIGAGVVIARYYGARDMEAVSRTVHTDLAFALAASVGLTLVGVLFTPQLLRWMGTPADVMDNSVTYLRWYFAGSVGIITYNACAGIFRAVGDSRHPLYFLITASVVNVALDLLLVPGLGVAGAAIATSISQLLSACLALWKLTRLDGPSRIDLRQIRFYPGRLREIVGMGLPTGVQNSVISFANVVVQTNVNAFGADAMAGVGSYNKLEGFVFLPVTSFCMALTTFVSQNLGARQYDRARQGARFGIGGCMAVSVVVGVAMLIWGRPLLSLFDSDPAVLDYGMVSNRIRAGFYAVLALSHTMAAVLRGAGKAKVPMVIMLVCWCLIRVSYITIAVRFIPDIRVVFWAYPITWTLSSILFLIYYFKADWVHGHERAGDNLPVSKSTG